MGATARSAGKSWLEKIGYSGDIFYKPDRACKENDAQPEILFAGISEGQNITTSPVDIYALIKAGDNFKNYKLEYGKGSDPGEWHTLVDKKEEQYSQPERIYTWDISDLGSTTITLRLRVNGKSETYAQKVIHLNLAVSTKTPTITPTPSSINVAEVINPKFGDPLEEYVKIYNPTTKAVDLTGWFIRDDGPNRYDFPDDFWIGSKSTIRLWTKTDWDTATDLYWDSPVEIWNDNGDCAWLRDDSAGENELIDVYCYKVTQDGLLLIIRNPEE